jgi:DNA modification methylase
MTSPPYFGLRDYGDDEQIGLEESLDEYISELVGVGDALRRVLRDDGSWWLNLGDSYAGSGRGAWDKDDTKESWSFNGGEAPERDTNLKRKNKMLVPHRVAIALQEAGWVVRNDVTWVKPNPMPQSVKDRLNTTTEQIFHLTPQPDYYFDLDAIREPYTSTVGDTENTTNTNSDNLHPDGKNPGDVFEVSTKQFPDAHFAVYPSALCDKPIKASCPPKVCVECGAPYERVVEREAGEYNYSERGDTVGKGHQASGEMIAPPDATHTGWTKVCECDTDDTEPGVVLDPFAGAGTTLLKAKQLGRRFVGVELNAEYADMARARVGLDVDDVSRIRDDEQQHGLDGFAE